MAVPERKKEKLDDMWGAQWRTNRKELCTVGRKLAVFVSIYDKVKASRFSYHHEKPWPYKWWFEKQAGNRLSTVIPTHLQKTWFWHSHGVIWAESIHSVCFQWYRIFPWFSALWFWEADGVVFPGNEKVQDRGAWWGITQVYNHIMPWWLYHVRVCLMCLNPSVKTDWLEKCQKV